MMTVTRLAAVFAVIFILTISKAICAPVQEAEESNPEQMNKMQVKISEYLAAGKYSLAQKLISKYEAASNVNETEDEKIIKKSSADNKKIQPETQKPIAMTTAAVSPALELENPSTEKIAKDDSQDKIVEESRVIAGFPAALDNEKDKVAAKNEQIDANVEATTVKQPEVAEESTTQAVFPSEPMTEKAKETEKLLVVVEEKTEKVEESEVDFATTIYTTEIAKNCESTEKSKEKGEEEAVEELKGDEKNGDDIIIAKKEKKSEKSKYDEEKEEKSKEDDSSEEKKEHKKKEEMKKEKDSSEEKKRPVEEDSSKEDKSKDVSTEEEDSSEERKDEKKNQKTNKDKDDSSEEQDD